MPTNALTNPLVLPILGLLTEGPLHGYGLYTALRDRYENLSVRRSTVYTLLDRLAEAGWVELSEEPPPCPFTITTGGSRALADGVARQIVEARLGPSEPFLTAVAYLGILTPDQAGDLLSRRAELTRDRIARLEQALATRPVRELHMLEVHYLISTLRHDAEWLERTTHRINDGDLPWPRPVEARPK